MSKNQPRWTERSDGSTFLSHWTVAPHELSKLASVARLTLWNVKLPAGFSFASLEHLVWLDLRGGTRSDVSDLVNATELRGLAINHVRGLADLSAISQLTGLRVLSLYGLAKLVALPDLSELSRLRRLEIGQLRNLSDWSGLLTPPALRELFFVNLLNPDLDVMSDLSLHPTLREFDWSAPDVPLRRRQAVRDRIAVPTTRTIAPEAWLAEHADDA